MEGHGVRFELMLGLMQGMSAGVGFSKLHFPFPHLVGLYVSCGVMWKWSFCPWALILADRNPVGLR